MSTIARYFRDVEPFPRFYRDGSVVSLLVGLTMFFVIHFFRILKGQPFWTPTMVVNIGDPALGGFAAAAAFAFRGYHANGSWYEKAQWFRAVLIGGAIINTGVEIYNVAHGFSWQEEFTRPSQVAHHLLTPIFYAYIAGVFPHLIRMWRENHNKRAVRLAFLFILIYAASISYDLSKGGSLAE